MASLARKVSGAFEKRTPGLGTYPESLCCTDVGWLWRSNQKKYFQGNLTKIPGLTCIPSRNKHSSPHVTTHKFTSTRINHSVYEP